jgi:glycerol-3-phosphate acyltransferase PlsY
VTELLIKAGLSYLLGSIVGSLLVGRLRGGVDIRRVGSGNAGATNALRAKGKAFALWVLLIDIGKGWVATRVIAPLELPGIDALPGVGGTPPEWRSWMVAVCGIAVMVGHVYPVWHGFRGGKGVATFVGVVLGIDSWLLLPVLLIWFMAVALFGFVGLASMIAAAALPAVLALSNVQPRVPLMTFGAVAAGLIVFTHRTNIARMRAGTEPRARRLWLFGRRRA